MRMSPRLPHSAVFSLAAVIHLLLFSIVCPVSGRIYRTKDAIVIEVGGFTARDLAEQPSAHFAGSDFGIPPPIPMAYASVNPYTGLPYQQPYPNFPFWPYPLYRSTSSSFSEVENVEATSSDVDVENVTATSSDSRQQNIACGVGPDSPPQRSTPEVEIVGGTDAVPNSWPFIVGLRISTGSAVFCGGSIISPTRILTAAHCVNEWSELEIMDITVSLGMHTQGNLPDTSNDAQQTRRVTRVVYHKDYDARTSFFDIAVLTIDPPINYSKAISPICLPAASTAADQFVNKNAAIMGWGKLKSGKGGTQPNALQQTTVKIISNAKCSSQYNIRNQQVCAIASGRDTCQGDSGGPMVVQAKASSTKWTQVGVTSYGNGCAIEGIPGVYASVTFFRDWIDTYTNN